MADLIHQTMVGGCSLEGQCIYVHFLFTWPTKEIFYLLTLISLDVSPPILLVLPDLCMAHFNHISATRKSVLKNEAVSVGNHYKAT